MWREQMVFWFYARHVARIGLATQTATFPQLKVSILPELREILRRWYCSKCDYQASCFITKVKQQWKLWMIFLSITLHDSTQKLHSETVRVHTSGVSCQRGPYLPCVSMAGRAFLAGCPRHVVYCFIYGLITTVNDHVRLSWYEL